MITRTLLSFVFSAMLKKKKKKTEERNGRKNVKNPRCVRSLSAELHALVREANRF